MAAYWGRGRGLRRCGGPVVSRIPFTRITLIAAARERSTPRARSSVALELRRPLATTIGPAVAAAVLGNVLVGRESQRWFRELRQPRLAVPFPAFVAVGGVYYLLLGVVRYRVLQRENATAARLGLVVLALNEVWNVAFFGCRSTRNAFFGMLGFALPLVALQRAIVNDRVATLALAPYTAWVLVYDVPWSYRLWRLNPS
jgi:translocator protein